MDNWLHKTSDNEDITLKGCLCCLLNTMLVAMKGCICVLLSALESHIAFFFLDPLCLPPLSPESNQHGTDCLSIRLLQYPSSLPFLCFHCFVVSSHNNTHTLSLNTDVLECERQTGRVFVCMCERRVIASNDRLSTSGKLKLVIYDSAKNITVCFVSVWYSWLWSTKRFKVI